MEHKSDGREEMIEGLRRHSRGAYSEAMRRYGAFVSSIVGMMIRDPRDAEEAVQDTFISAFRAIGRFDESVASFQTWLGRIAYNRSVDSLRRRTIPTGEISELTASEDCDDTDENLEADIDLLREALELLAPVERTLLTLVYFDDIPLDEVAYIMQLNRPVISSRLYRLRNKLARIINERKKQH